MRILARSGLGRGCFGCPERINAPLSLSLCKRREDAVVSFCSEPKHFLKTKEVAEAGVGWSGIDCPLHSKMAPSAHVEYAEQ